MAQVLVQTLTTVPVLLYMRVLVQVPGTRALPLGIHQGLATPLQGLVLGMVPVVDQVLVDMELVVEVLRTVRHHRPMAEGILEQWPTRVPAVGTGVSCLPVHPRGVVGEVPAGPPRRTTPHRWGAIAAREEIPTIQGGCHPGGPLVATIVEGLDQEGLLSLHRVTQHQSGRAMEVRVQEDTKRENMDRTPVHL